MPLLNRRAHAELTRNEQGSRVRNHSEWEANDTKGAIRAKGRQAVDQAIARGRGKVTPSRRRQRNNFREY